MRKFGLKVLTACPRVGLALLAIAATVCSQALTVVKIAPIPSQTGLSGAYFMDSQKGFACSTKEEFYRTLDGGATWNRIPLAGFQPDPLYNVTFMDANVGIVCGNSTTSGNAIYRTTNGGQTWASVAGFPVGGSWYHQDYPTSTTGFIGSNGAIVRTTDAGATWQLRSWYPTCPSITGMDFLDANVGFAGGGLPTWETGLFKTIDGGVTWTLVMPGGTDDVIYLSPTTLLTNIDNNIWRSQNGGNTWFQTGASISTGMIDFEKVTETIIIGVSGKGDIWRSSDGGYNWTQMWIGEGDLPSEWEVHFATPQFGTVSGGFGLIYGTTDGGLTWTRINRGASFDTFALAALDDNTIVTAGHHGFAQRFSNNGDWNLFLLDPPTFGRDTSFSAISSVGSDFIYAVGHEGSLARSTDGGHNWETFNGVAGGLYANDVTFTDRQNGWLTGWAWGVDPPETYQTHDGGVTWTVSATGNFPGVAIEVIGSRVWIQSGGQTQWRSTNGGATFVAGQVAANSGSAPSVYDISFATSLVGYACGYDGYMARTLDGGVTWTQLGSVNINTHNLAVVANGSEVWVCGARSGGGNAFVKRSLDRGASWQTWNFGGTYTTPSRMVRTTSKLYLAGYRGEIWRMDGLPKLPKLTLPPRP